MSDALPRPAAGASGPPRTNTVVAVLAFAGIVVSLMQTLVIPLIPELPHLLHASAADATWAITATLLAGADATPGGGPRGDRGGQRPSHMNRGYYIEPTVFAGVDNSATIAQEEIFGPVLSVIPAADEEDAIRIANDTIYGLNASVFTPDADKARAVAARLRSGTVGHNGFRTDFGIAFGGFKQSGIGREGGVEGLHPYLETKTVILEGTPSAYGS